MVQALSLRRSSLDLGTPGLEQLAAAHLLTHEDAPLNARCSPSTTLGRRKP